jgi:site-specific DNA-methyltransferase (adenine-specific)
MYRNKLVRHFPLMPFARREVIGNATLYLGDCRDISLPPLATLVTDPPYGMGYKSNHNSGRKPNDEMLRLDGDFAAIAGDDQPFNPAPWLAYERAVIWGANYFCSGLPSGNAWLVWDKLAGKTPFPSGSDVEFAWTSWRGPSRHFTHLWRGIMRAGEENVVHSGKQHPNQKPVALMTWCIEQAGGNKLMAVLDPYMGSGTTGVAAVRIGRAFIGVELEEPYFEISCERIANAQRQERLFA